MSVFVDEIIKDLKDNPQTFKDYFGQGVQKENIVISRYGNGRILSITKVSINEKEIPTSYSDCWNLEVAITNWYKTVSLNVLLV